MSRIPAFILTALSFFSGLFNRAEVRTSAVISQHPNERVFPSRKSRAQADQVIHRRNWLKEAPNAR